MDTTYTDADGYYPTNKDWADYRAAVRLGSTPPYLCSCCSTPCPVSIDGFCEDCHNLGGNASACAPWDVAL